jgi:hypothetical protein
MNTKLAIILACFLGACPQVVAAPQEAQAPQTPAAPAPAAPSPAAPTPAPAKAQVVPRVWNVDRVRCSDLIGASDEDRAAAVMFYYGYLAARAGIHVIDVSQIDGNVHKVMDQCGATPNMTVPQAFRQALGRRR